jgi:arsenite/tail-anchored protein-transporting ATPase
MMIHHQKLLLLLSLIHHVVAFHTTGTTTRTRTTAQLQQKEQQRWLLNHNYSIQQQPYSTTRVSGSYLSSILLRRKNGIPQLHSINPLIASIEEQISKQSQQQQQQQRKEQQTILVGGKGGVGKTTTSAALAIELASTHPNWNILIVSTDPAHSLGDALDIDLHEQNGQITLVDDPIVTQGRLYAQEINADIALEEFRTSMSSIMDIQQMASTFNVSPELLESLGIQELQSLIQNPPPGLDELVALSNVFSSSMKTNNDNNNKYPNFDVVIVDTAPTGHTLRLLALPQFLNGLVGKLIKFRLKLSSIASTLQSMFNSGTNSNVQQERQNMIDTAMDRMEEFQQKVEHLRTTIQNSELTKFVVVTVPTQLAVAESKRLINELQHQSIMVSDLIINQCIINDVDETNHYDKLMKYYNRRVTGQQKWIQALDDAVQKVSQSSVYQQNIGTNDNSVQQSSSSPSSSSTIYKSMIEITKVPFFDVELVGIPALGYIGSQVYMNNPKFDHLLLLPSTRDHESSSSSPKVVICGGKGGVGKTTSSASLAVSMAICGHKVALISTDPAHSLGDAVQMNLTGGQLHDCPLIGVPGAMDNSVGSLSVLEIDPSASLNQFKDVVNQLMGNSNNVDTSGSNSALRDTVKDLQDIFDTLPAGTDEVVALAKIINLVKKGGFDRIVLDTAPTGHTLRMLSTPGFLADLIERLLRISDKLNSNSMVQLMLLGTTSAQRREEIQNAVEAAKSTLLSFQFQMYDLEDLFANAQQTEFMIVTVPTELAVRESIRLLNDLTYESPDMPIKVRNVIINQVLNDESDNDSTESFLSHISATQRNAIYDLQQFVQTNAASNKSPSSIVLSQIPYLDLEPRGVFGLKALASELTVKRGAAPEVSVEAGYR